MEQLKDPGIPAMLDATGSPIGEPLRAAEIQKIPVMLVVGAKEAESGAAAVRRHRKGDLGVQPLDAIVAALKEEIADRRLS